MIYKQLSHPGTPMVPVKYVFLAPARLRIRDPLGNQSLQGFGIGEHIHVLEPEVQLLVALHEEHTEIPLPGGWHIVEWPSDLQVQRA